MTAGFARVPEPHEWVLRKTCTKCGETKPWAAYSPKTYGPDGSVATVQSYCRACHKASYRGYQREYRQRNAERIAAYKLAWEQRKRADLKKDQAINSTRLPAHPFKVLLWEKVLEMDKPSWLDLAEQCGVPERSIRRVLEQENVSLVLADKICTRLGARIYDLWPDLEEAA